MTRILASTTLAASVALIMGCGGDDNPAGGQGLVLNIRNGTWAVHEELAITGSDTTCSFRASGDTTLVLCDFEVAEDGSNTTADCDFNWQGNELRFECTATTNNDPCFIVETLSGTGVVTDTTIQLSFVDFAEVRANRPENQLICEIKSRVPPCAFVVDLTAVWLSAEGDSLCGGPEGAPLPLETFLSLPLNRAHALREGQE